MESKVSTYLNIAIDRVLHQPIFLCHHQDETMLSYMKHMKQCRLIRNIWNNAFLYENWNIIFGQLRFFKRGSRVVSQCTSKCHNHTTIHHSSCWSLIFTLPWTFGQINVADSSIITMFWVIWVWLVEHTSKNVQNFALSPLDDVSEVNASISITALKYMHKAYLEPIKSLMQNLHLEYTQGQSTLCL